jgi:hypothetical protein
VRDVTGSEAMRVSLLMEDFIMRAQARTLQHPGRDAFLNVLFHGVMATIVLYIAFKQIF